MTTLLLQEDVRPAAIQYKLSLPVARISLLTRFESIPWSSSSSRLTVLFSSFLKDNNKIFPFPSPYLQH